MQLKVPLSYDVHRTYKLPPSRQLIVCYQSVQVAIVRYQSAIVKVLMLEIQEWMELITIRNFSTCCGNSPASFGIYNYYYGITRE
jgi:hypothetical protein